MNTILYYDWAYGGTGYKNYARGLNYPKVQVNLKLLLPPGLRGKKLTISQATGEGFADLQRDVVLADGQRQYEGSLQIAPLTGITLTIK